MDFKRGCYEEYSICNRVIYSFVSTHDRYIYICLIHMHKIEKDCHFGSTVGNDAIRFAVITIDRYDRFERSILLLLTRESRGLVVFRIVERVINGPWVPIIGGHGVLVSARHTRPT